MWEMLMKNLFPDESVRTFQRVFVTALTGLGTILLGTLLIWGITLLINVSKSTVLGYWGVATVLVIAGAAAIFAWRGYPRQNEQPTPVSDWETKEPIFVPPPAPIVDPLPIILHSADEKMHEPRPQSTLLSESSLKGRFNSMIDNGRLDEAEVILAQSQMMPELKIWHENAQRQLANKRKRLS